MGQAREDYDLQSDLDNAHLEVWNREDGWYHRISDEGMRVNDLPADFNNVFVGPFGTWREAANAALGEESPMPAQEKTLTAYAPNGLPIVGQLHAIPSAVARIVGFSAPDASTEDHVDFEGYTEVNWDSQRAVLRGGELVYVDEEGYEWVASDLTFKEESA